jgi:putative tryptophan/tyrosine transport system substrate-binding protein
MTRRAFNAAVGLAAFGSGPLSTAQPLGRVSRIGVLWHAASAEEEGPYYSAMQQGFRNLGYVEGRNIVFEHRFPNEQPDKFVTMAEELVSGKPDVLLAVSTPAAIAATKATITIPIVFVVVPDPVASKLVDTLARPGANVTGLSNFALQVTPKRVEFLKKAIPDLSRLALLINPNVPISRRYLEESEAAAVQLGIGLHVFAARSVLEIEPAFDAIARARMQAVAINADGLFFQTRSLLGRLAVERGLPTCGYSREILEAGILLSYGPDQRGLFVRSAGIVDRILKGRKPSEIPVELPTKIEFLVNGKTAQALTIRLPQSLLLQADEVIH